MVYDVVREGKCEQENDRLQRPGQSERAVWYNVGVSQDEKECQFQLQMDGFFLKLHEVNRYCLFLFN